MRLKKVLMIACNNSGTSYYRQYCWWVAAHRMQKGYFHVLGWEKNQNGGMPWQHQIADSEHSYMLLNMLSAAAAEADVIISQRVETRAALQALFAIKDTFPHKPLLAECDDDVTDITPYNQASEFFGPGSELNDLALSQFKNSDGMIVSTPYLKDVYSEYNPNIYVLQNSIDLDLWSKVQRKKRGGIRIGWSGGTAHSEDLKLLETVIPAITEKNPEVKFVFVSNDFPEFLGKLNNVELIKGWSPILKYPTYLAKQDFDIGIAPLRDNKFNRAKSNLRWLEYSALGIPTVASKVGHFKETIRDGVDGLLAETPEDFIKHLQALISDKKLRKQIGTNAYFRIEKDFNIDHNVDIMVNAVEDALTKPVISAPSFLTGVDDMRADLEPLTVEGL